MKARLIALEDVLPTSADLSKFEPEDPTSFHFGVVAHIGAIGDNSDELFEFEVCTLIGIGKTLSNAGYRWGRPLLILERWDYRVVENAVIELCEKSEGRDWNTVAHALNRFMKWEYEDYVFGTEPEPK